MPKKDLILRVEVLDYWIDKEKHKAYCLTKLTDVPDNGKISNLRLAESDYNDNN